jgi:hypothetical protein
MPRHIHQYVKMGIWSDDMWKEELSDTGDGSKLFTEIETLVMNVQYLGSLSSSHASVARLVIFMNEINIA